MARKKKAEAETPVEETEQEAWQKRFDASLAPVDESGLYRDPIPEEQEEDTDAQ